MILRFDGAMLAFPASEVLGVESLSSIRQHETLAPAIGTIEWDNVELPAYRLSAELDIQLDIQQQQRFCICLATQDPSKRYALVGEAVEQYAMPEETRVQELPAFMRVLHTPVHSLFRRGDSLALLCSAESLGAFIVMLEERYE